MKTKEQILQIIEVACKLCIECGEQLDPKLILDNINLLKQNSSPVEPEVSDDLVREVEEKFSNTMLGMPELPQEYPGDYYTNFLKVAYDQAKAMNLNDNLALKHCCTVLNKIINYNQSEKIREALIAR